MESRNISSEIHTWALQILQAERLEPPDRPVLPVDNPDRSAKNGALVGMAAPTV